MIQNMLYNILSDHDNQMLLYFYTNCVTVQLRNITTNIYLAIHLPFNNVYYDVLPFG